MKKSYGIASPHQEAELIRGRVLNTEKAP